MSQYIKLREDAKLTKKIKIPYLPPSDSFLKKHGNVYCACCKKNGVRTPSLLIPVGPFASSVLFKKEFATCMDHLLTTQSMAEQRARDDRELDTSEAMAQISYRYGV